jgi:hypothetical protein
MECFRKQSEGEIIEDNNLIYAEKINTQSNKERERDYSIPNKTKNKAENSFHNNTTIIINNNINNYHYNLNINNNTETYSNKKRNRMNSFEGLFNLFPDLGRDIFSNNLNFRKNFDEKDYMNNFEYAFKETKNDFDCDKDILQEIVMLSNTVDSSNRQIKKKYDKNNFEIAISPFFEDINLNFDKEVKVKLF